MFFPKQKAQHKACIQLSAGLLVDEEFFIGKYILFMDEADKWKLYLLQTFQEQPNVIYKNLHDLVSINPPAIFLTTATFLPLPNSQHSTFQPNETASCSPWALSYISHFQAFAPAASSVKPSFFHSYLIFLFSGRPRSTQPS